ncbi:MAG: hypothetical protein AB8G05_01490 [Oligoflexales bacterium]
MIVSTIKWRAKKVEGSRVVLGVVAAKKDGLTKIFEMPVFMLKAVNLSPGDNLELEKEDFKSITESTYKPTKLPTKCPMCQSLLNFDAANLICSSNC